MLMPALHLLFIIDDAAAAFRRHVQMMPMPSYAASCAAMSAILIFDAPMPALRR